MIFDTFCCFTLKTAAVLIGVMQMLIYELVSLGYVADVPVEKHQRTKDERNIALAGSVVGLVHVMLSCLLVYGADKEQPRLLKPWIALSAMTFLVSCALVLAEVIAGHGWVIFMLVPGSVLAAFCHLVVYRYYVSLTEGSGTADI